MSLSQFIVRGIVLLSAVLFMAGIFPFSQEPGSQAAAGITPTALLVTMTVRPNGCTVHVVGAGQTLWAIALAYGVKVNDIQGLNNMGADNVTIYPGETLVIRCMPLTPTVQPSLSPTAGEVTGTATRAPATPTPTSAAARVSPRPVTPTAAAAAEPGVPGTLVAGLLILGGGTLVVLLVFGLIRKR